MIDPRSNTAFIGNHEAQARLVQDLNNDTLKNAYIISGTKFVGKETLAFRFIRQIIANNVLKNLDSLDMSSDEKVFKQVENKTTANLLEIQDDKANVDTIRQLLSQLQLHTQGRRAVLINNAENLNASAANCLLKILEEPPLNTTFILITSNYKALLPTIKSRAVNIALKPIADEELAFGLSSLGLDPALSQLSQGCIGRAIRINDAGGINIYKEMVEELLSSNLRNNNLLDKNFELFQSLLFTLLKRCIAFKSNLEEQLFDFEEEFFKQFSENFHDFFAKISRLFFSIKSLSIDKDAVILWTQESIKEMVVVKR